MHFVKHRVPGALEQISRVLAIPNQRTDRPLVDHLTAEQCKAILDRPEPTTRLGIRDRAMLHLSVTAGLRVSELVGLRLDDVAFESRYLNLHVRGKGPQKSTPHTLESGRRIGASLARRSGCGNGS
jgi:integrase/recombinase XerD